MLYNTDVVYFDGTSESYDAVKTAIISDQNE